MATKYVTVKHVPLCKVGTWGASTGPTTVTPDVLMSMVEAEAEIGRAVVKIGHRDPRFNNPTFDGDPVYGQVANLTREGDVLYGDLVNVPSELADSMKSAYPNRSVEIAWGVKLRDAAGSVRKTLKAALIGLALLGNTPPAVKGLTALSAIDGMDVLSTSMLSADLVAPVDPALETALRERGEGFYATPDRSDLTLTAMADGVAHFTTSAGSYKCSYELDENGVAAFSDTVAVNDDFPQQTFATGDAEHVSENGGHTAGTTNFRKEQVTMDFLEKLRVKLELPEGATEDEIFAAANKAPATLSAGDEDKTKEFVSKDLLDSLTTEFSETKSELAEIRKERAAEKRDAFITSMLSEGKIHVSEHEFWRGQMDRDEEATKSFLSARTPVVPVSELGSNVAGQTDPGVLSDDEMTKALTSFGMQA